MSDASESQYLSVIRVWAAVAWADGVVADEEAEAIRRLISVAELTTEERMKADAFLSEKVELQTEAISGLSNGARLGIYRAALKLAMVDRDMAAEEASMLARIREGLKISDEDAEALEKEG